MRKGWWLSDADCDGKTNDFFVDSVTVFTMEDL